MCVCVQGGAGCKGYSKQTSLSRPVVPPPTKAQLRVPVHPQSIWLGRRRMSCPVSTLTKRVHETWLQGKVAGNRAFCIQPQVFLDRTEPTASLHLVSSGTYSGIYHYAFSLYCTRQGKQSWFGVVREMHAIWGITRILQITPWLYKLPYFTKHHQNHFFSRNSDSYLFKSMVAERSKRQTEFQSSETVSKIRVIWAAFLPHITPLFFTPYLSKSRLSCLFKPWIS